MCTQFPLNFKLFAIFTVFDISVQLPRGKRTDLFYLPSVVASTVELPASVVSVAWVAAVDTTSVI